MDFWDIEVLWETLDYVWRENMLHALDIAIVASQHGRLLSMIMSVVLFFLLNLILIVSIDKCQFYFLFYLNFYFEICSFQVMEYNCLIYFITSYFSSYLMSIVI